VGGMANLPMSVSFFCFLCQAHRSHCASHLDQWGLKTRHSAVSVQGMPFGDLNGVPNFFGGVRGKTPQKLKFWA